MILTLRAVSLNDQPLSRPITARFDAGGGTIGRADHSTLALPDPERFISRTQAEVVYANGGYRVRNVAAANPVGLGKRSLAQGESAVVLDGDELRVGGYLLRAELSAADEAPVDPPTLDQLVRTATPMPARAPATPSPPALPPSPQARPAGVPPSPQPATKAAAPVPSPAAAPKPAPAPITTPVPPPAAAMAADDDPFADLLGGGSADELLSAPGASGPPPGGAGTGSGVAPGQPVASVSAGALPLAMPLAAPEPPAPVVGAAQADPFADLLGAPTGPAPAVARPVAARAAPAAASPFGDLLPPAAGLSAGSAAVTPPAPAPARLPDDFDPFADILSPAPPRPAAGASPAAAPRSGITAPAAPLGGPGGPLGGPLGDPLADLLPAAPAPGIDASFGLAAGADPLAAALGSTHDPLRDFELGLSPPAGTAPDPLAGTDPLAMFAAPLPGTGGELDAFLPSPPAPSPGHATPAAAAPRAPLPASLAPSAAAGRRAAPMPATTPVGAAAASRGGPLDAQALWQAFCDGAGIGVPLPADAAQAEARMRQIGQVMRTAVEGTRELMAVRASTKYEMRAAVTQIMARSNNPLKFAPDTRTGLEQLVQPATRGFLEGPAAMDDAWRDLVGHSIGTVAGMRAAIEGMLDRFDPASLEQTLGAGSMLDSLVPLNRKARLWELYLQRYRGIKEEAQEDFHALFGKAFVAAYEQQVERFRQGADPRDGAGGGKPP